MDERFYTPKQVAEILQVHQYTVLKWIREGKLRALKFGRVYRTSESELRTFLGQTAHESAQEIQRSVADAPMIDRKIEPMASTMVQTSSISSIPSPVTMPPRESEPEVPAVRPSYASQPASYASNSDYQPSSNYRGDSYPEPEVYRITSADQPAYSVQLEP